MFGKTLWPLLAFTWCVGYLKRSPDKVFLEHLQNLQEDFFCKCFSISKPENAKAFTKFCKCCMDFVNALAFSKGEMLKHLQDFFVNFTNVNALARAENQCSNFKIEE